MSDAVGRVVGVSLSNTRGVRKFACPEIEVVAGLGVAGDIHAGVEVRHLARVRKDPTKPNLRQVHVLHRELLDELRSQGIHVGPADMGENVLTEGIDVLRLPSGTRLELGERAVLTVTGLRNPCKALNELHSELLSAVVRKGPDGTIHRKSGVMAIAAVAGKVRPGDPIVVRLPPEPHSPLQPV